MYIDKFMKQLTLPTAVFSQSIKFYANSFSNIIRPGNFVQKKKRYVNKSHSFKLFCIIKEVIKLYETLRRTKNRYI